MTTIDSDNAPLVSTISTRTDSQEDRMTTSSTTTTPIERKKPKPDPEPNPEVEPKPDPVPNPEVEPKPDQKPVVEPKPDQKPVVEETPGDSKAAGECSETPCYQRTPLPFTYGAGPAMNYTFFPGWKGNVAWDFGDGTPVVTARGNVNHTYASAGDKTVTATPLASACLKAATMVVPVA